MSMDLEGNLSAELSGDNEASSLLHRNAGRRAGSMLLYVATFVAMFAVGSVILRVAFPISHTGFDSSVGTTINTSNHSIILVSVDGFRWDYLERKDEDGKLLSPNLNKLRAEGVSATKMQPVMPSKTFPNHWSIVTGLFPAWHGIIDNVMYDADDGTHFRPDHHRDPKWWGGEPIWATVRKAGMGSATVMWPGSQVESELFTSPEVVVSYDRDMPYEKRVSLVMDAVRGKGLPSNVKPAFVTLYLNRVDSAGHAHGPNSDEVMEEIRAADEAVGSLVLQIASDSELKTRTSIIFVSDHGMTEQRKEGVLVVDDVIDPTGIEFVATTPLGQYFNHKRMSRSELWERLQKLDVEASSPQSAAQKNVTVMKREDTPDRWHYRDVPHGAPIVSLTVPGTSLLFRTTFEESGNVWGEHGHDNEEDDMQAILIAKGPVFASGGVRVEGVRAVDVYATMCKALRIEPAPNNGSASIVKKLLQ